VAAVHHTFGRHPVAAVHDTFGRHPVAAVHHTFTHKQYTQYRERKIGKCGPCPVFASYTVAFPLQLRNKHGKTSVSVAQYKNNEAQYKNNESTIQEQAQYKNLNLAA
jgi:hypothetical protein